MGDFCDGKEQACEPIAVAASMQVLPRLRPIRQAQDLRRLLMYANPPAAPAAMTARISGPVAGCRGNRLSCW